MERTRQLIDQLEREEIEHARSMSFAQKFLAGAELFEYACAISKAGIRMQHPDYSEQQVLEELRRRISIGEKAEARQ